VRGLERNLNKLMTWKVLSVLILLISSGGIHAVMAESPNSTSYSVVKILAPVSKTYDSRFLTLKVSFTYGGLEYTLTYTIDGKSMGAIPWTVENPDNEFHVVYTAIGSVKLPELSEGSHFITVTIVCGLYGHYGNPPGAPFKQTSPRSLDYEATWTDTVNFTIDSGVQTPAPPLTPDTTPPNISNLSIENKTYLAPGVPLNFTVDGNISKFAYSLDGTRNITIAGNITLMGLSLGMHNLIVYAWDDAGNVGVSQTVTFAIADASSAPLGPSEPFSTASVLTASAVSAAVALGAAGFIFYGKKRRAKNVI
jgi:hypothetical protein